MRVPYSSFVPIVVAAGIVYTNGWAQTPAAISLDQAQQTALRNHPRIASAALAAEASGFVVKEVHSAYYPTVSGNVNGVGSEHNSTVSIVAPRPAWLRISY
jgi:outer membrane protein TolC